jgi:hypothetical protein
MSLTEYRRCLKKSSPSARSGYAYSPGRVTWSAQVGPVLDADSPDALREAIKRAYVELLEKIGEQTRGASRAAVGEPSALATAEPACDPVAEP